MRELQTLQRGLDALAFLNAHGPATLATIARHLDLPRPNVDRILRTLVAGNYCTRIPHSTLYLVAPGVRRLSEGLRDVALLTATALPILEALGKTVEWPVALAVPHGMEMQVRLSTDMASSLALLKARPGYRTPILLTTTGLLYLAFLSEAERMRQLPGLVAASAINPALSVATLEQAFAFARTHGYLLLDHGYPEASLGVPILSHGRPLGGLVMRYVVRGLKREDAITQFLPKLHEAAGAIVEALHTLEAAD